MYVSKYIQINTYVSHPLNQYLTVVGPVMDNFCFFSLRSFGDRSLYKTKTEENDKREQQKNHAYIIFVIITSIYRS